MTVQELIKKLAKEKQQIYSLVATVKSVDKDARTCEVVPIDNEEDTLFDVRLQSAMNSSKGFVLIPKVDSLVVVTFLNDSTGYVGACSDVESLEIVMDDSSLDFDENGLSIQAKTSITKGDNRMELDDSNIQISNGGNVIKVDASGIEVKGTLDSLGGILSSLIDEINSLQIIVASGAGVVNPTSIAKLTAIKLKLKAFLK